MLAKFRVNPRLRGVGQHLVELILKGHTAKSIAQRLALSESSIVTYRRRAYKKLNISRKSELVGLMQASG